MSVNITNLLLSVIEHKKAIILLHQNFGRLFLFYFTCFSNNSGYSIFGCTYGKLLSHYFLFSQCGKVQVQYKSTVLEFVTKFISSR